MVVALLLPLRCLVCFCLYIRQVLVSCCKNNGSIILSAVCGCDFPGHTRGIWKVLSMVFYLSNRFTNLMFGIILKGYLSSMSWHKFQEDVTMQTRKILL